VQVENAVVPQPEQVKEFLSVEGPVMMVNLLRFREYALYPDGSDRELSGRDAYERYAKRMRELVEAEGGRFVFGADALGLLLGEVEDTWHSVGIVEYPDSKTLVRISASPKFQEIEGHRLAGLEGQLNITCRERPLGE